MPASYQSNQLINVQSNQYRIRLSGKVTVFQYRLEILGMQVWDANLVQKILRFKRSALEKALGLHVPSGE